MIKNRIIAVVLISVLTVLTACSSSSTSPEGSSSAESQTNSVEADASAESNESNPSAPQETGSAVSFETTDLEGNTVNSSDIFSANKLTMVNIWGTFCGPCIDELPELEKLNYRLKEKNCSVIGIVSDVAGSDDSATIESAKTILDDTGVKYPNLLPWSELLDVFPAQFIPTTYFVDSEGRIIGEAAIGARSADAYEELIDSILKTMD